MGWDVYCCICGNSCKGCDFDYLKDEFDSINIDYDDKLIKDIVRNTKWMNKGITLLANNKIKKNIECEDNLPFDDADFSGIFVHFNCLKFVKINYNIELKFNNLPVRYKNINFKNNGIPPVANIDYGIIQKYWDQDFKFNKIYSDNNLYMLNNPLIDSKNANRIKKIISQFKLKKELRPSPQISATFYNNNEIKIGSNNNFWIVKNKKWSEINEKIIKKIIILNNNDKIFYKLKELPRIGEYNINPVFLTKIEYKKNKRQIEIIGTQKYIETNY